MKNSILLLFLLGFLAASCGSQSKTGENAGEEEKTEAQEENKTYKLTAFETSTLFEDASIESMTFRDGKFKFGIGGETYKLGVQTPDADQKMCANSGQGQHIHLIVDNSPYAAKYEAEFDYEIEDGEHYLLAFLSRSYHESIKSPLTRVAQKVTIENNSIKESESIKSPMVFYSRPKGEYIGKKNTEKVMLDFYLEKVENFGKDYKVKADINGEEHTIDTWQPYYIEGLPLGENTIKLTLVDSTGASVDAPLNPVERKFMLKADPAEEAVEQEKK